jgi:HlyD family secretion protein
MPARPILAVCGVLGAIAGLTGYFVWFADKSPNQLRLAGTVEVQEVRLSSRVGGRVLSLGAKEGDLVKPGQTVVTLEATELEARRDQIVGLLAAAAAAQDRAKTGATPETRAAANAAVAGAEAHLARVKAKSRPQEIDQARHELNALLAEVEFARAELTREQALQGKTAALESRYDAARAAHERLKAQAEAAKARLRLLEAGPRTEDVAEAAADLAKVKAQRDLTVAPTRYEDLAEATAKVNELTAKLRELDTQVAEAVVKAPEAAVIEVLAVRPGDVVAANQPVARVLRADDLWVKAYIPATELGKVKLDQAVEVTIDSHPGRRFAGTVAYIATTSEFTPRNVATAEERANQMFAIKVRVPDPDGIFKSGMAADVYVPAE